MLATLPRESEMYDALVRRDASYEGIFIAAVKTTQIFCRPTCSAKKPAAENVEYYPSPHDALQAGYRACKRCRPMERSGQSPEWLQPLMEQVDLEPARRWKDDDLRQLGVDPERVRRWFKANHDMTFHAYHRLRRLGSALGSISQGGDLSRAAFDHGFESLSAFRDAFALAFGVTPGRARGHVQVFVTRIVTPLGPMLAGVTDEGLCLLEFVDRRMLATQIKRLVKLLDCAITPGDHPVLAEVGEQLTDYFAGDRTDFELPTIVPGTDFQVRCWNWLRSIPYGQTASYAEQAQALGVPNGRRAVGRANGDNRVAIVIPCHRVVRADGQLAGYGGGVWRKRKLIEHEQRREAGLAAFTAESAEGAEMKRVAQDGPPAPRQ